MVTNGKVVTPLLTDSVLESITRDTVIKIAKAKGIEVEERTVDRTELYTCDEAFFCGSAMEITPVLSIDQYQLGNGTADTITALIHEEYLSIVKGEKDEYKDWVTPIYGE